MAITRDESEAPPTSVPWHARPAGESVAALQTDAICGLASAEAAVRLACDGSNVLRQREEEPWWKEVLESLGELQQLLLLAVVALYFLLGEAEDALTMASQEKTRNFVCWGILSAIDEISTLTYLTPNELIRRYLLRRQAEKLPPTLRSHQKRSPGFSFNARILLENCPARPGTSDCTRSTSTEVSGLCDFANSRS
jgi:hypothetical protein